MTDRDKLYEMFEEILDIICHPNIRNYEIIMNDRTVSLKYNMAQNHMGSKLTTPSFENFEKWDWENK